MHMGHSIEMCLISVKTMYSKRTMDELNYDNTT